MCVAQFSRLTCFDRDTNEHLLLHIVQKSLPIHKYKQTL